jgi:hypothetical protein
MTNFRLLILSIVLVSLTALAITLCTGDFWPWYWRQNVRLVKAGWNMIKLFRRHDLFDMVDDRRTDAERLHAQAEFFDGFCEYWKTSGRASQIAGAIGQIELLSSPPSSKSPSSERTVTSADDDCSRGSDGGAVTAGDGTGDSWRDRAVAVENGDSEMLQKVPRVPLEYAIYARLSDQQLSSNWYKFVSNKCSKYYDKLICLNGLVFDWNAGTVSKSADGT